MNMQKQRLKYFMLTKDTPIKVQLDNIQATAIVSSLVKSCLGPKAFQKMILTKMGSIETTNDGNAILRELDVSHPALKMIFELARTQDEEAGDGTTTVVLLCGEILKNMAKIIEEYHPIHVCNVLISKMNFCLEYLQKNIAENLDPKGIEKLVKDSVNTKLCRILNVPIEDFALKAAKMVFDDKNKICDIKNNIRVEKILGDVSESKICNGLMVNKNIIHPQMRKRIENPRIAILETNLEYKKGESQMNYEFSNKEDFTNALVYEDEHIKKACKIILDHKIDVVCVEKGVSDLALSILQSSNVTALRRFKKTELERLAKVTGAISVGRADDLNEKLIGKACNLFDYQKIGEEYYCFFESKEIPKAASVLLRGPSKYIMNELDRNFQDAIKVARNLLLRPKICPGGGATEMALAKALQKDYIKQEAAAAKLKAKNKAAEKKVFRDNSKLTEMERKIVEGLSDALKTIPSLLVINSGNDPLVLIPELEAKHEEKNFYGIDGISGKVVDIRNIVREPLIVKSQCIKSAIETVCVLLRVDGVIQCADI